MQKIFARFFTFGVVNILKRFGGKIYEGFFRRAYLCNDWRAIGKESLYTMKYEEWIDIWLENYVKTMTKLNTYEHYKYLLKAHVVPYIGRMELSEITAIDLQRYVSEQIQKGNKITGGGLSPNTVNTIISVLQGSFRTAQNAGQVEFDPSDKIKRPKKSETRVECFSLVEQKQIEQCVMTHKKIKMFGVLLCLYTGLRIGELLALEWSDVDLEKGLLSINKSSRDNKSSGGEKRIVGTPKSRASRRVIPLPKQIIPMLKEYKQRSSSVWVISDKGQPVSTRSYQRSFELLLKKAGVEHKGFHALRHTFATRAIECGVDAKTLSEILGHKNPTITLNVYVHSLPDHKKDMMNKIGEAL